MADPSIGFLLAIPQVPLAQVPDDLKAELQRILNAIRLIASKTGSSGLPVLTDAQIIVGLGAVPTAVTVSGDATITNAGVVTINPLVLLPYIHREYGGI